MKLLLLLLLLLQLFPTLFGVGVPFFSVVPKLTQLLAAEFNDPPPPPLPFL